MQTLAAQFKNYLTNQKLSPSTLANYVSDADQFLRRLAQRLKIETVKADQINPAAFADSRRILNEPQNHINPATARRALISLKRFGAFLVFTGLKETNPAASLHAPAVAPTIDPTISKIVSDFRHALLRQNLASATIKNYVSDVKNYLNWAVKTVKITGDNL